LRFLIYGYGDVVRGKIKQALEDLGIRYAIVEVDDDKIRKAREEGIIAYKYGEEDELIKKNYFDAAIIATPPRVHYEIFEKLQKYRIPVAIEKPLAHNLKSSEDIVRAVKRLNIICMAIDHYVFKPPIRRIIERKEELREIFDTLEFIKITFLEKKEPGNRRWMLYQEEGGGVVWEYAVHAFATLLKILGKVKWEIKSCKAYRFKEYEGNAEDYAETEIIINDKIRVSIIVGRGMPKEEKVIEFFAKKGRLKIDLVKRIVEKNGHIKEIFEEDDSYKEIFRVFKNAIREGKSLDETLELALESLKMADEAIKKISRIEVISKDDLWKTLWKPRIDIVFIFPFKIRGDIEDIKEKMSNLAEALEYPDENGIVQVRKKRLCSESSLSWARLCKGIDKELFHPIYLAAQRFIRAFLGEAIIVIKNIATNPSYKGYQIAVKSHFMMFFHKMRQGSLIILLEDVPLRIPNKEYREAPHEWSELEKRIIDLEFLIRPPSRIFDREIIVVPEKCSGISLLLKRKNYLKVKSLSELAFEVLKKLGEESYEISFVEFIGSKEQQREEIISKLARDAFIMVWINGLPYKGDLQTLPDGFIKAYERFIFNIIACPWRYYQVGIYDYYESRFLRFYQEREKELNFLENTSARKDHPVFISYNRDLGIKIRIGKPIPDYKWMPRIIRNALTRELVIAIREFLAELNKEIQERGVKYGKLLPGKPYEDLLRRAHRDLEELYNLKIMRSPIWRQTFLDTIDRLGVRKLYENVIERLDLLDKYVAVASYRRLQFILLIIPIVEIFFEILDLLGIKLPLLVGRIILISLFIIVLIAIWSYMK